MVCSCSSTPSANAPDASSSDAADASEGDDGSADAGLFAEDQAIPDVSLTPAYPPGPYGVEVGDVVPDLTLVGYPAPATAMVPLTIRLDDFYNPTGHGSYPSGSPYGADALPTALVIDVGGIWCSPCDQEANTELSWRWAAMQPAGQILTDLLDGPTVGMSATAAQLTAWDSKYHVEYPTAADPTRASAVLVGGADANGSCPTNFLVRTADMRIVAISQGLPDAVFWESVQALVPGDSGLVGDAAAE
jgi:hypothetical protein